jgi:zinc finger protein
VEEYKRDNSYNISKFVCPECGNEDAAMISHILDIPHYDDFMMLNLNCKKCGLRTTDFFNTNSKGHTIYTYHIEDEKDGVTKIVRASFGKVSIPELGVSIDPKTGTSTWIRNVEGVLDDINKKLFLAKTSYDTQELKNAVQERMDLLNKFKNFELPFTIIVEDPEGNSLILPAVESRLEIKKIDSTK